MAFANIQGAFGTSVASGASSWSVTLSAAPTLGHLVIASVYYYNPNYSPLPTITIKDGNSNSYTLSPSSPYQPSGAAGSNGYIYIAYLLSAPSNATATITVTVTPALTTSAYAVVRAEEFSYGSGTLSLDTDIGGHGTSATTINSPSITPAASGELLYAFGIPSNAITSANSPWTQDSAGIDDNGDDGEYILSAASGSTSVNFTQSSGSGNWFVLATAFKLLASANTSLPLLGCGG